MKTLLLKMLRGWLLERAMERIIEPLRKKVHDTNSKWDDQLLAEVENKIFSWLK